MSCVGIGRSTCTGITQRRYPNRRPSHCWAPVSLLPCADDEHSRVSSACAKSAKALVRRYAKRIWHVAAVLVSNGTLCASDVRMLWELHERASKATVAERLAVRRGDLLR